MKRQLGCENKEICEKRTAVRGTLQHCYCNKTTELSSSVVIAEKWTSIELSRGKDSPTPLRLSHQVHDRFKRNQHRPVAGTDLSGFYGLGRNSWSGYKRSGRRWGSIIRFSVELKQKQKKSKMFFKIVIFAAFALFSTASAQSKFNLFFIALVWL